jgi:hypothetical protein
MPYDPRTDPKYKNDKLLLALTHQESRFNPNAVSPTGARGLTQVLPSTARSPGFGIAPNPGALNDPEQNMAFGKAYLSAMQKRYKGDNAAALVAYNGGPGKADEWVKSGKNDKVLSKETSNYYKSVLGKAGEGFDFSKIKQPKLPSSVPSTEDEEDETEKTTGFSKLKAPGSKNVPKADKAEDTTNGEAEEDEADTETEKTTPKVKAVKASKKEADDDDDEEDDDEGSKSGKSGFSFDAEAAVPKLKPFEPGLAFKPMPIVLGQPKLQIAQLELDNPRDR